MASSISKDSGTGTGQLVIERLFAGPGEGSCGHKDDHSICMALTSQVGFLITDGGKLLKNIYLCVCVPMCMWGGACATTHVCRGQCMTCGSYSHVLPEYRGGLS